MECWILRTNKTIKRKRVSNKKDSFSFEGGTYYVIKDNVLLKKSLLGFKSILFYIENYSEPLSLTNIKKKKGKDADTVLIDAKSIHNLTSRELLSVLTKTSFSKVELLLMGLLILNLLISIASLGGING